MQITIRPIKRNEAESRNWSVWTNHRNTLRDIRNQLRDCGVRTAFKLGLGILPNGKTAKPLPLFDSYMDNQTEQRMRDVTSLNRRLKGYAIALLLPFAIIGCAAVPQPSEYTFKSWSVLNDCLQRDVQPQLNTAADMALTCAGSQAAEDPRKSGIDRASAHFNAALAFNLLAEQTASSLACETRSGCYRFALDHIERSFIHQQAVNQPQSNAGVSEKDQRFNIRRSLVHAAALKGASETQLSACGTPEDCLTKANQTLGSFDWDVLAASKDPDLSDMACRALYLRSEVNFLRGPGQEPSETADLRRLVQKCPDLAATATKRLARIAFDRAEKLYAAMTNQSEANSPKSETISVGNSAVSSYTDALRSEELKLSAYRNIGRVHLELADLDRANAAFHFESAIDAFSSAQTLSQADGGAAHAGDLEILGTSYLNLVDAKGKITKLEEETLVSSAVRALESAVTQMPSYKNQIALGAAYSRAGRVKDAEAAYRAALALGGSDKGEQASLSLARLLEHSGKPGDALALLETQYASGSVGSDLEYELGRLRFVNGNYASAVEVLAKLVERIGGPRAAEAHYMAGVSESVLRRSGWQSRMRTHADAAAQSNSFSAKYIRLDCLAHILSGGKDVKTGSSLQRCPTDGSPERSLLRGMYFLKQAQLIDISPYDNASQDYWRSVLRLAEDSFRAGQSAAKTQVGAGTKLWFDDLQREIMLEDMLANGLTVVSRCRREISIATETSTWAQLESFFGHYGVLKCSAS